MKWGRGFTLVEVVVMVGVLIVLIGFTAFALTRLIEPAPGPLSSHDDPAETTTQNDTALHPTTTTFTSVKLRWPKATSGIGYTLEQSASKDFSDQVVVKELSINYGVVEGLKPGTTYYFRVKPIGTDKPEPWSNVAEVTTLYLGAPKITSVIELGSDQIQLSWQPAENADNATFYVVKRAADPSCTVILDTYHNIKETSKVIASRPEKMPYYYQVFATTSSTTPHHSVASACRTLSPATPSGVSVTAPSATQLTVSWDDTKHADRYIVFYGPNEQANAYSATTSNTSTTLTDNILPGGRYYIKVAAVAADGVQGNTSATVSATTSIDTPKPFSLVVSNDGTSLTADASQVACPDGSKAFYFWRANGIDWVYGTEYNRVSYALSPNQSITLTVAARCINTVTESSFRWASNAASHTRPAEEVSFTIMEAGTYGTF